MHSARNQLAGTVASVKLGGIMAEVVIAVGSSRSLPQLRAGQPRTSISKRATKSAR